MDQKRNRHPKNKKVALFYVAFQAVIAFIIIVLMLAFWDAKAAYSAFLAGVICVIANTYFGMRLSKYRGAGDAKKFMVAFYTGEITKLAIIVVLMLLALSTLHILIVPFLLTFVILQILMSFAPLLQFRFVNS